MGNLTANLSTYEFSCRCPNPCDAKLPEMDKNLVQMLQELRNFMNRPLRITSGARCTLHNSQVGGSINSSHVVNKAADIECTNVADAYDLLRVILKHGLFNRVGLYHDQDCIHVDVDANKPQEIVWVK